MTLPILCKPCQQLRMSLLSVVTVSIALTATGQVTRPRFASSLSPGRGPRWGGNASSLGQRQRPLIRLSVPMILGPRNPRFSCLGTALRAIDEGMAPIETGDPIGTGQLLSRAVQKKGGPFLSPTFAPNFSQEACFVLVTNQTGFHLVPRFRRDWLTLSGCRGVVPAHADEP